jgi:cation transport ATPase
MSSNLFKVICLFVFVGLIFCSCSLGIQKRKYLSGYYLSVSKSKFLKTKESVRLDDNPEFITNISLNKPLLVEQAIEIVKPISHQKNEGLSFYDNKNIQTNLVNKKVEFKNISNETLEEKKARKVQFKKSVKRIGIVAATSLFTLIISALVLSFITLSFFEGLFFISLLALAICFLMLITALLRRIFFRSTFKKSSLLAFIFVVAFILGSIVVYLNLFEN